MRTNADQLEHLVLSALSEFLVGRPRMRAMLLALGVHGTAMDRLARSGATAARLLESCGTRQKQCALTALIKRIELSQERLKIVLRGPEVRRFLEWNGVGLYRGSKDEWQRPHHCEVIDVPAGTVRIKRSLALPIKQRPADLKTVPNAKLVGLIRDARAAQALIDADRDSRPALLAARLRCGQTRFARLVRLNYLAPDIVTSILDGTQPQELTRRKLIQSDLPMDWALQRRMFGFPEQPDYLRGPLT